jgi:hypothetical protein
MAISMKDFWLMMRKSHRDHYEREIAEGRKQRLDPELEKLLFQYGNDQALTVGHRIPLDEINAKADEFAAQAGVSREEFKEIFLNEQERKRKA